MKPRKPVLTIDFFVSQVQPGLLQTRNLSLFFDTSSSQLENPPATVTKYDTSHKHANCQDDCEADPAGGICDGEYYSHSTSLTMTIICLVLQLLMPEGCLFCGLMSEQSRPGKARFCRALVSVGNFNRHHPAQPYYGSRLRRSLLKSQLTVINADWAASNDGDGVPTDRNSQVHLAIPTATTLDLWSCAAGRLFLLLFHSSTP
jgi:hypothetical protein